MNWYFSFLDDVIEILIRYFSFFSPLVHRTHILKWNDHLFCKLKTCNPYNHDYIQSQLM